jgi:Domain of unknown function (DUF4190)/Protein of unknown function (DUF2510)
VNDEQQPVPGWYADPEVPGGMRYWDGGSWSEHRTPPAGPPPPMPKTSGMAIASLVLGIVWVYGITSILAIIFAVIAKRNIRESNGWVTGGGMATAGLVLGIIGVVATIAIIIAIAAIGPEELDNETRTFRYDY